MACIVKRKIIYVLPYVSVVSEKVEHLTSIFKDTDITVAAFHGGAGEALYFVFVCFQT